MSDRSADQAVPGVEGKRLALLPAAAVLVAAIIAVYGQTLGFEFVKWDDGLNIHENPHLPLTTSSLAELWTQPYFMSYLPVVYTVWGAIATVAQEPAAPTGYEPAFFHLANVVLHAASALLVLAVLRRLMGSPWPALAGAALFALHPLQVEPVAWVSGFKDLLATFLGLLAIICYLRWARAGHDPRRRAPSAWYIGGLVLYALALLTKPAAAAVPLVAWALDVLVLRRQARAATLALAPWLALAVPAPLLLHAIDPTTQAVGAATPLWLRPLVAGDALAFYLGKLILPRDLTIDYGRTVQALRDSWWMYAAWVLPVALGWLVWRFRRRYEWLPAAGAVLLAGLLPTLGLVPIPFQEYSTVADRYTYLAMLGPALAVTGLLRRCGSRPVWLAAGVVIALLGFQSALQAMHWRNSVTLFSHVLEVNPDSWVAHGSMGAELIERGNASLAMSHLKRAIELCPDAYEPRTNYATALRRMGREEEAIEQLRELVRHHPEHPVAHDYLACMLDAAGKVEEAREHWREAIRLDPELAAARHNLAVSYYRTGEVAEAVEAWRAALAVDPDYRSAREALTEAMREHPELRGRGDSRD